MKVEISKAYQRVTDLDLSLYSDELLGSLVRAMLRDVANDADKYCQVTLEIVREHEGVAESK